MRITELPHAQPRPRRIAVGEFDGVHLGHREVIRGNDTVLTFEPHPLQVVRPEAAPKLLTSLEAKAELVAELGVEELVVIPFDQGFAHQSAQEFIDDVLVAKLGATNVSVGENFRFGHGAAGDPDLLAADPRFETRVVDLVEVDGEVVSSSHIRALVLAGEVDVAARLLGAPFRMRGTVVPGDQRGRELGYPTANVAIGTAAAPADGVYAGWLTVLEDGSRHPAAISVGTNPTFEGERLRRVEAHVLDRDDLDLYDREVEVAFTARIRGMERFDGVEALLEAMAGDVISTRLALGLAQEGAGS
jgi:riboflavin kinase/FMN adenylyltransferase